MARVAMSQDAVEDVVGYSGAVATITLVSNVE